MKVDFTPETRRCLDALSSCGMYGNTPGEVALALIQKLLNGNREVKIDVMRSMMLLGYDEDVIKSTLPTNKKDPHNDIAFETTKRYWEYNSSGVPMPEKYKHGELHD